MTAADTGMPDGHFKKGDKVTIVVAGNEYDMTVILSAGDQVTVVDVRGNKLTLNESSVRLTSEKDERST